MSSLLSGAVMFLPRVRLWRDGIGVQPQTTWAIHRAADVLINHGLTLLKPGSSQILSIYSVMDGTHHAGSRHYLGFAFDIRIWNFADRDAVKEFADLLRIGLGSNYDVIVNKDHIHVEYDAHWPAL